MAYADGITRLGPGGGSRGPVSFTVVEVISAGTWQPFVGQALTDTGIGVGLLFRRTMTIIASIRHRNKNQR